ncbi:MAG: MFS transporter [Deferrisomatales bacterium]|nr:MFS transporter [Deferrisomatales bacterium]
MKTKRAFNLRVLLLLSTGHLVTDIYQGALPGLLPLLKDKLDLTYAAAGTILLASNLTSSVVQPLFGFLSDKREKPLLLPVGCLFAGLGFSLLSLPGSYGAVLCLVALSGLGVASYHPEGYKTASYFTGTRPAAGMSLFSVGGNLGFAVGPALCLWLVSRWGLSALPAMAIPSLLFVALIGWEWRRLAAHRGPKEVAEAPGAKLPPGTRPALALLIATVVMRSWTHIGLMTYIPFHIIDHLQGDPVRAGQLVSALLLGGVVGTLGGSPLADRWGHRRYLLLSLGATSVLFPLVLVARGPAAFLVLGTFGAVLISTFTVTIVMAQRLLPDNLGVASGLMVGFAIGTGGLGVTLLGAIADRFGVPAALNAIGALPPLGLLFSALMRYPAGQSAAVEVPPAG